MKNFKAGKIEISTEDIFGTFEEAEKLIKEKGEGWRLPTRREAWYMGWFYVLEIGNFIRAGRYWNYYPEQGENAGFSSFSYTKKGNVMFYATSRNEIRRIKLVRDI